MTRDPSIEIYSRTFQHVWDQPRVPTPAELADWLVSQKWRVDSQWLADMVGRLRVWPVGMNYPLIPDDEAMAEMQQDPAVVKRWWEPGAIRGDLRFRARTRRGTVDARP